MKIFVIHGWTYNLDKWEAILPVLKAQGIEPVMLKVPGLTEPSKRVFTIDDYIKWLDGKIGKEKEPIVIGHSNGGRIALAYAQKNPGKIKKLILIDSAGLAHNGKIRKAKLTTLRTTSKLAKPLKGIPGLKKVAYKTIGAQDYYNASPNMRETMQNMLKADQEIDLSKVSVQTAIIWGSDDTITPLKDGKEMHRLLKGSRLDVISGGRHAPMNSHPEEVALLIKNAL